MSVVTRSLGLLGLVLLMVISFSSYVFADDVALLNEIIRSDTAPSAYPYLSPDPAQRAFLLNAFKFQSGLFTGIATSGESAGIGAFTYLAMLAALVGSLLVILFPKFQKASVIGPWLLVVILVVFSPYGSKLLFQPVDSSGSNVNCTESPSECGFNPQLIALHIATTLQVVLSDTFNSVGWTGLVEGLMADQELEGEKGLIASEGWYLKAQKFKKMCSAEPVTRSTVGGGAAVSTTPTNEANSTPPPRTLGDVWDNDIAIVGKASTVSLPPALMVLYDESNLPDSIRNNDTALANYNNGLNKIYETFVGDGRVVKMGGGAPSISFAEALTSLSNTETTRFFDAVDVRRKVVMPGFFFVKGSDLGRVVNGQINAVSDQQEARRCYTMGNMVNQDSANLQANTGMGVCADLDPRSVMSQKNAISNLDAFIKNPSTLESLDTGMISDELGEFGSIFNEIKSMPVGVVGTDVALGVAGSAVRVTEARTTLDCPAEAKDLVKSAIDETIGGGRIGGTGLQGFIAMLNKERPITYKVTTQDMLGSGTTDPYTAAVAQNLKVQLNKNLRLKLFGANGNPNLSDDQKQEIALKMFIDYVYGNTAKALRVIDPASNKAAEDGETTEIVGNETLTSLGGGMAVFFGKILVHIGAFFSGPLAAAIVAFVSILVDLALMALIVLTPFMFLAGAVMPTAAIGVLTISVLGVFILKFVPVTLIILNNIGGLIRDILSISDADQASTMEAMLVIAMSGVYGSLVGMTFFLLFKLGDPSAILGRMTALDGAAKQIADKGMGAAILAATTAATLATGGAMALAGRGSMGLAARKAANKLGISNEMIDGAQGVMKQANAAEEADKTPPKTPEQLANEEAFNNDPDRVDLLDQMERKGFTDEDQDSFKANGYLEKDGRMWFNENGILRSTSMKGLTGASPQERLMQAQERSAWQGLEGLNEEQRLIEEQASDAWNEFDEQKAQEKAMWDARDAETAKVPPTGADTATMTSAANTTNPTDGSGAPIPNTGGAGGAPAQGTGPLQVSVVDGKLSTVGEIGSIQASAELSSVQAKAAALQEDAVAKELASQKAAINLAKKDATGDNLAALNAAEAKINDVKDEAGMRDFNTSDESRAIRPILAGAQNRENYSRNMNDQIANEIARLDSEILKGGNQTANMALRKELAAIDPIGLTQGELMARMGNVEEMKKAIELRGAADSMPGYWQSFVSGVYGAGSGGKGALGKIPIIGPAISEATNEYYQAPERARAWNAVGGRKEYKQLQADAQRMGFFQKEMAPIGAGTQYQSMMAVGAFQVQADLARQTASEAVAKSRSQYEAMVVNSQSQRGGSPTDVNFRNFMTAGELTGLGRMEAADRVASVRQEAFLMQGNSMVVKRAVQVNEKMEVIKDPKTGQAISALDDNMQIQKDANGNPIKFKVEEVNTVLTAQALHKFRGDITTKKFAGNFDEMMIAHYGLAEKQYLRGNVDWDGTRDMNKSAAAAALFARKDVSTDYLIGGHTKMVEGKIRFKDSEGQYKKLVEFRGDENRIKAEFIRAQVGANGLDTVLKSAAALEKPAYDFGKAGKMAGDQLRTYQREAMDKYATEMLKGQGRLLKLDAIFDEAGARGVTKYEELALIAPAREATRKSKLNESIIKEYSKMFEDTGWGPDAFKSANIRRGGVSAQQGDLIKTLTENLTGKVANEDMGRVVKALVESFKSVKDSNRSFTNTVKATVGENGPEQEMVISAVGVTPEGFEAAKSRFASESGLATLWTAVSGLFKPDQDSKQNGYYRVGSTAIEDDGTKHIDQDIKIKEVIKDKRS